MRRIPEISDALIYGIPRQKLKLTFRMLQNCSASAPGLLLTKPPGKTRGHARTTYVGANGIVNVLTKSRKALTNNQIWLTIRIVYGVGLRMIATEILFATHGPYCFSFFSSFSFQFAVHNSASRHFLRRSEIPVFTSIDIIKAYPEMFGIFFNR